MMVSQVKQEKQFNAFNFKRGITNISGIPHVRNDTGVYLKRMDSMDTESVTFTIDRSSIATQLKDNNLVK